jgi:uncharacterized membrane protein YesL
MTDTTGFRRAGMRDGWQAIAHSVADLRYVLVPLIYVNVLWIACCLPIITLPAATAALYVVTQTMNERRDVSWREFIQAMKDHFFAGWRWVLVNALVGLILVSNIAFYIVLPVRIAPYLAAAWIGVVLAWVTIQLYCYPVLLMQVERRVLWAVRNSVILILRHPLYAIPYVITVVFFVFVTWVTPYFLVVITPALIAFLTNGAVLYLVEVEHGNDPEKSLKRFLVTPNNKKRKR